jgi:hypothetical protein
MFEKQFTLFLFWSGSRKKMIDMYTQMTTKVPQNV